MLYLSFILRFTSFGVLFNPRYSKPEHQPLYALYGQCNYALHGERGGGYSANMYK